MRSLLYFILSLVSLAYLALFVIANLAGLGVIDAEFLLSDFIVNFMYYAPLALLAGFAFINFSSRSIKILFLIILIIVVIAGVIVLFFPEIFAKAPAAVITANLI